MDGIIDFRTLSLVEFSAATIVLNILLSFGVSFFISWIYKITHRGISYSQSFVITLVVMGVLSSVAMMILGNNIIRALGILGVFTLLRFRTIVKDSRDASFLFFVLTMGMAIGTNNYSIVLIATPVVSLICWFLYRYNFGSVVREGHLLTFIVTPDFTPDAHKFLLTKYCYESRILQLKSQSNGETEYYLSVRLKKETALDLLVAELRRLTGVTYVDLITSKDSAEY